MPLPLLQKLLGHSSIRTTALYWQNIYQEPDNDNIGSILAGKDWLEKKKPLNSPIMENFPETPKTPKPIFIGKSPVISNKKPTNQDNSLSVPKLVKKTPGMLISEISPKTPAKFFLNPVNKKNDQLKISQQLVLIPNQREKMTEKELILLQKIKVLEKQLVQVRTEISNLKTKNQNLKMLIKQGKKQTEAKIIQLPPFLRVNNK